MWISSARRELCERLPEERKFIEKFSRKLTTAPAHDDLTQCTIPMKFDRSRGLDDTIIGAKFWSCIMQIYLNLYVLGDVLTSFLTKTNITVKKLILIMQLSRQCYFWPL